MELGPGSLLPHTVLLTQTSRGLSRGPSQTLQDQTGHHERACYLLVWEGTSFKAQVRWNFPQVTHPSHPRGAMLLYQEGALASSILDHCWDWEQGTHTSGALHSHANVHLTSVNHIPPLWAHLHLLHHTGLASVRWTCRLPPKLHIGYNQIPSWLGHCCHSGLGSNITSSERIFLTTSPPPT